MAKNDTHIEVSKNEKVLLDLVNGVRKPETKDEKELQADIEAIKKKGRIIEIPSEIF